MPKDYHDATVLKMSGDGGTALKLFECPLSVITPDTWDLIRQVNLYTDDSGRVGPHLPEPEFPLHQQSPRFLKAVELMRREKNSDWFREQQQEQAKKAAKG